MKQARRTCACVYACAVGLSLSLVLPGRAAERQVSATLTPAQGLDLSRAQFAAAADADIVLEDRWLSARRGAQLAIVPEEAPYPEAGWRSRVAVNVPGQYLLRDAAGECHKLVLSEPFAMGYVGQPTYLSITATLTLAEAQRSRGAEAAPLALAAPAGGLEAARLSLPLRPDLFCFGPDGSGLVAEAGTGAVARLDLRDGTVLAQTALGGALPVALLELEGLVYRFDTAGTVARWDALSLSPAPPLQLPRRTVLELPEVRAAFADPVGRQIVVVGSRALWAVSADGTVIGPRPCGEAIGELTGLGGGVVGRTLWLAARDAQGRGRAVPVAIETLTVGPAVDLLPAEGDSGALTDLAVDPAGGLLVAGADGSRGFVRCLQPGGQPQLVPVPEFGRGPNLTLSADGRRLALWQPGGPTEVVIREVAPAESEAAQKVATGRPTWVVFSPDGRWLLLGEPAERQLRVVSAEPERLATVALAPSE